MAATRRRKRIFGKRLTAGKPQLRELSQPAGCTNATWEEDQFPSLRHRDFNHGRQIMRRTSSPMKRPADVFPTISEPNEPIDPDVIYGPYTQYPRRFDDVVCVRRPRTTQCPVPSDPIHVTCDPSSPYSTLVPDRTWYERALCSTVRGDTLYKMKPYHYLATRTDDPYDFSAWRSLEPASVTCCSICRLSLPTPSL